MDTVDGIETARRLRGINKKICIIFVTGYMDYVLEGYKVGALRYLVKDSLDDSFGECMEAVLQQFHIDTDEICLEFLENRAYLRAEEYLLFSIKSYDGALEGYMNVLAVTKDTEWTAEQSMSIDGGHAVTMNDMFRQYLVSEDYRGELDEDDYIEPDYVECFGVMAVTSTGSSPISNLFNGNELAHMLPFSIAYNNNQEAAGVSCEGTLNLPATTGIIMCDGTISQRVLLYDKDSTKKVWMVHTIILNTQHTERLFPARSS